ncbi:MAG: hypothetical protein WCP41_02410 [Verrucomicrobiota bacterium]
MNTNTPSKTTEIALILDQSGSMESIRAGTIEGVNAFLDQQREESSELPARFSLTLFSTVIETRHSSIPVNEVPHLGPDSYHPSGGTALLDAIGTTVDELGKRLAETPEADRPEKVVVAIMTDGEENSSRTYTWDQISEKIKHQTDVYKWEFLFMGANQDAIATASRMNIHHDSSANYFQKDGSAKITLRAMSSSIRESKRAPRPHTPKSSLSAMIAEEEAREQNEGK